MGFSYIFFYYQRRIETIHCDPPVQSTRRWSLASFAVDAFLEKNAENHCMAKEKARNNEENV